MIDERLNGGRRRPNSADERLHNPLCGHKVATAAGRYWGCQEQEILMRIPAGAAPLRAGRDPLKERAPAKK